MLNLIGDLPESSEVLAVPDAHLHLYGKSPRPGRKLATSPSAPPPPNASPSVSPNSPPSSTARLLLDAALAPSPPSPPDTPGIFPV